MGRTVVCSVGCDVDRARARKSPSRATRSSRTRSSPSSSTSCTTRSRGSSGSSTCSPPPNSFEGHQTLRIYNLLAFDDVWRAGPGARARAADRRARARPGLPHLVAVVDRHPPRRDRAADPRRRPAHPAAEAAPADRVQLDVGAHRLHRGERRDAARSRARTSPTTAPTTARRTTRSRPRCRRARCSSGTAASGTAAARTPPTRRASASR